MGTGGHTCCQLGNHHRAAYVFKLAHSPQFVGDGEHVDRLLRGAELLHRFVYLLVGGFVEIFRLEDVADGGVSILFKHQGAENGFFNLDVAWCYAPFAFKELILIAPGAGIVLAGLIVGIFGHLRFLLF